VADVLCSVPLYYFEITVVNKGAQGFIGAWFSSCPDPQQPFDVQQQLLLYVVGAASAAAAAAAGEDSDHHWNQSFVSGYDGH
jgi:hypothetical protein